MLRLRYSTYAAASLPGVYESPSWPAAWVHFRLCALFLAAGFAWTFNLIVFASFGINWQLIFGDDISVLANLSAAFIARICGAAFLWLWVCVAMFVQSLGDIADGSQLGEDSSAVENALVWPQVASAVVVWCPVLLLFLPLPVLHWRSRVAWMLMIFKMVVVPFTEVKLRSFCNPRHALTAASRRSLGLCFLSATSCVRTAAQSQTS
jgi:hypothetical protein